MNNYYFKIWHIALVLISIFNIVYLSYNTNNNNFIDDKYNKLVFFAFIYTIICSMRSIWLKKPIHQICLNNSILSSPFLGRLLSTISELSFATQITLLLKFITSEIYSYLNIKKPKFKYLNYLLPIIYIAQTFCWFACITKFHLWNAIEETLWTIFAIIIMIHCIYVYTILPKNIKSIKIIKIKKLLQAVVFFILLYIAFMVKIDIPTYIKRWKSSYNNKLPTHFEFMNDFNDKHSDLSNKLFNLFTCKKISNDFSDWKDNIAFFSGYFTVAVWSSIYIPIWYKKYKLIK